MPETPRDTPFPRALRAPSGPTVRITAEMVAEAVALSRRSPRGRIIYAFHESNGDNLHRMLNALQPGSYVRPHRHLSPAKAEALVVLQGSLGCVIFDDQGRTQECFALSARAQNRGADIRPGVYHTIFALEEDTVIFEVKPGPYHETTDKEFARWAPAEGTPEAARYLGHLVRLVRGSQ